MRCAAIIVLLSLIGIVGGGPAAHAAAPSREVKTIAAANNTFATDLYGTLRDQPGNLFFSPLSISTALAMAEAGAGGQTRAQMGQVLHLETLPPEALPAAMQQMLAALRPSKKAGYQLSIANALWAQQGFPLHRDYLRLVQTRYDGKLQQLDFAQPAAAAKTINDWVQGRTNQKIKDLIPPDALGRDTALVLTNAIYFKGDWDAPFTPEKTKVQPFTTAAGAKVDVPLMQQSRSFRYAEDQTTQVLQMPYAGGELAMLVLLPRKADGLPALEKSLSSSGLEKWDEQLHRREVEVSLPRFTMTHRIDLKQALVALGMRDAFDPNKADFSGIASHERLVITDALHKAFVEVNEKGTEAAAGTGLAIGIVSLGPPPVVFRADRPFVFLIRDTRSGAILFLGRVADPKS